MQKLQIKEEIMAVAALLALGVLAVLATNGNVVYGQTNVVYGQTSKAWFAVCM
jgi:P pilus assembly chaperone PapD